MLRISLIVAGLLLIPPTLTVGMKGAIAGAKEFLGEDNFVKADLESPMLVHVFYIDCSKNLVFALLCLSAALFFDTAAQKTTAMLMLLLDSCAAAVQVIAPLGPGVAPWPALDGLFSNPVVLPILGGQMAMLTLGLLTSGGGGKKKRA